MRSFFHYKSYNKSHLEDLLLNNRIKFSKPDELNDLWEFNYNLKIPENKTEFNKALRWFEKAHRNQCPNFNEIKRSEIFSNVKRDEAKLNRIIEKTGESLNKHIPNQYRVYCLTNDPISILMWAHYGNNNKGICVEYEADNKKFRLNNYIEKVAYSREFPIHKIWDEKKLPMFRKPILWKYENEFRIIAEERSHAMASETLKTDNDFFTFPIPIVRSIIIGARTDDTIKLEIEDLIKHLNPRVILRQCHQSKSNYSLNIETL